MGKLRRNRWAGGAQLKKLIALSTACLLLGMLLSIGSCKGIDPTGEWAGGIGFFSGKIVINGDGTAAIDRTPVKWKMVESNVVEFESAEQGLNGCRMRIGDDGNKATLTSPRGMTIDFSRYK